MYVVCSIHVQVCESMYAYGGQRRTGVSFITSYLILLGQSFSPNLEPGWGPTSTSDPPFPQRLVTSTYSHAQLLTWILKMRTQVLVLVEQELLPTEPSSQPLDLAIVMRKFMDRGRHVEVPNTTPLFTLRR